MEPKDPSWLTHALSWVGGLFGGGIGTYLLFVLRSRKQSSDDLRSIIAQLSERLAASDKRIGILETKVETLHIENIGNGPTYAVGEKNRTMASMVWTVDRRTLVELMTAASVDSAAKQGSAG